MLTSSKHSSGLCCWELFGAGWLAHPALQPCPVCSPHHHTQPSRGLLLCHTGVHSQFPPHRGWRTQLCHEGPALGEKGYPKARLRKAKPSPENIPVHPTLSARWTIGSHEVLLSLLGALPLLLGHSHPVLLQHPLCPHLHPACLSFPLLRETVRLSLVIATASSPKMFCPVTLWSCYHLEHSVSSTSVPNSPERGWGGVPLSWLLWCSPKN